MRTLFLAICLLLPKASFAIMCPGTFNQIFEGDTIAQVQAKCGQPTKVVEKEVTPDDTPQEWSYYVPQTVTNNALTPMQGTLKTQLAFDASGKAINISVNGIGVGSTNLCGRIVQLGDSRDQIKAACGDPSFINKQQPSDAQKPTTTKMTQLIYGTSPPTTLTFENGKFKEKQ